jgi:hypothetical protein
LAYAEFHFTETLWPDFNEAELDQAIASYRQRERRFGRTSEQLVADPHPSVAHLSHGNAASDSVVFSSSADSGLDA